MATAFIISRRALLAGAGALSFATPAWPQFSIKWIELEGDQELIRFPGTVNGHPVSLMLDSGAGNFVVDERAAAGLGVAATTRTVDAQGLLGARQVKVSGPFVINFNGVNLTVNGAFLADLSSFSATGLSVPIFLGAAFLGSFAVEIDFPRRRLGIHKPGSFSPGADARKIPLFRAAGGERQIEIVIEGHPPVRGNFDTGSSNALTLDGAYAREIGLFDGRPASTWISAQVEGIVATQVTTARKVRVGDIELSDVDIDCPPSWNARLSTPANIGFPLIHRLGRVVIDYASDALYVYPSSAPPPPFDKDTLGLALSPRDGGGWTVLHVAAASPAAKAGWKPQEVIASIDGKTGDRDYKTGAPGTVVSIVMADGSKRSLTRAIYY